MTIPADPDAISVVVDRVTQELEGRKWGDDDVTAVQVALTEAVANAIRHGCRGDITKRVQCSVGCGESDEVVIVVRDPGDGFDPGGVPDPDPANTFKPSGRGMFLMRAFMDHVCSQTAARGANAEAKGTGTLERVRFIRTFPRTRRRDSEMIQNVIILVLTVSATAAGAWRNR
jgi:serine/threonine-protein kinase RsbW